VTPEHERALALLHAQREGFVREFPNRWIAVNAHATVRSAARFDLLLGELGGDAEMFVFAYVTVGAWA
jgi:hypothetical protein